MSINRRTAIAVRSIGVASAAAALALGVAGNAFACNIGDFSANIQCDKQSGNGTLTVHDTDGVRPVTITVKTESGEQVTQQDFSDKGGDFTLSVPWKAGTHYIVTASVKGFFQDKVVEQGSSTVPDEACEAPAAPPESSAPADSAPATPAPADSAPATPTSPAPATATATPTTPAPAVVADTNAPSPAGGTSDLAETGGGSNAGMIAGVAAVLVAAGGGTVFMLRRRSATARH